MKRDSRLHGLSSDHHHALVLVWRIRHEMRDPAATRDMLARTHAAFRQKLLPHFVIEEEVLLPALRDAGGEQLAERTMREHAAIRAALERIDPADPAPGLLAFAALLHDHVRFEESDLFTECEQRLPPDVLDEAARRAPKSPRQL